MKTQEQLDQVIRNNKGNTAVEALVMELSWLQEYRLSDGTHLVIHKETGTGHITTASGSVIRRF